MSLEFSRQKYWSGEPFPPSGDLLNSGIGPEPPALQADALPSEPPGKPSNAIEQEPSNIDGRVVDRVGESLRRKQSGSAAQGKGG